VRIMEVEEKDKKGNVKKEKWICFTSRECRKVRAEIPFLWHKQTNTKQSIESNARVPHVCAIFFFVCCACCSDHSFDATLCRGRLLSVRMLTRPCQPHPPMAGV